MEQYLEECLCRTDGRVELTYQYLTKVFRQLLEERVNKT